MSDLAVAHPIPAPNLKKLAKCAKEIRAQGKKTVSSIVAIGKQLIVAKKLAGHGNWQAWLQREFSWSENMALKFMQVAEANKSINFMDLDMPVSSVYLLASPSTPRKVREAVVKKIKEQKAKKKPRMSHKKLVETIKMSTPAMRKIAKEAAKNGEVPLARQIELMTSELTSFLSGWDLAIEVWAGEHVDEIEQEHAERKDEPGGSGKQCLMRVLQSCANQLMDRAQKIDGR